MPGLKPMKARSRRILMSLLALTAVGCGEDFEPRTRLEDYSVLGIESSPPQVSSDGTVQVRVHEYFPDERAGSYTWSLCPYSLGATAGYECEEGTELTGLSSDASFSLDLGPQGIGLRRVLRELGPRPRADGSERSVEQGFDVWLKLTSGPRCEGCSQVDTVKRLGVRDNAAFPLNANPRVLAFDIVGERTAGSKVELVVETSEPEQFSDPTTGEERSEEYLYTWFSTQGETSPGLTFGEAAQSELVLSQRGDKVEVVVAVRDGRGGLAVERRVVLVE